MPWTAKLEADLDAELSAVVSAIESRQEAYFAAHGRYCQMLDTHTAAPRDGEKIDRDNIDAKPHDQTESGRFFEADIPDKTAGSFSIDVCQHAKGRGFAVNVATTVDGVVYRRTVNHGPEESFESPWSVAEKPRERKR